MAFVVNDNTAIRQCQPSTRGLGLFATKPLSKGLRIMAETPLLIHLTRDEAVDSISEDFRTLPEDHQKLFIRLFAGRTDLVPFLVPGAFRDSAAVTEQRLQSIVRYNSIEGQGTGSVISLGTSAINHSCVPNAFVYWNESQSSMTLHAVCPIARDEEIMISSTESETRRRDMAALRRRLTAYYQNPDSTREETYVAMCQLRELVEHMETEGLYNLELSLCLVEQARLFQLLGDAQGRVDKLRKALQARLLCLGADNPTVAALVAEIQQ